MRTRHCNTIRQPDRADFDAQFAPRPDDDDDSIEAITATAAFELYALTERWRAAHCEDDDYDE